MPELSSTSKKLLCNEVKCRWVIGPHDPTQCNANQICFYEQMYGAGNTSGLLLSETLRFPEGDVVDVAVGCSILSSGVPEGIFDDNKTVSSELLLYRDSSNSGTGDGGIISYTKFRNNPELQGFEQFEEYYYLNLRKISVGGNRVKIPHRVLVGGADGNSVTIIDSGSTFTTMDNPIYDLVEQEFVIQMSKGNCNRATYAESPEGFRLCYAAIGGKPPVFPELMFHFKGGAKLSLPMADYFSQVEPGVACMMIFPSGLNVSIGPSIIIGNYQQQDIYVEYDLENGRFGFEKKKCN
ncbi:unnamed protein product [Lactuca virosa]|uniref:Peptidase A1 domain-containing protein n=1 Tax=Lactuca virosa TaxID=75947 RepID=A0AAU9LK43_9ASTR|nr:unnamed protein product [Lactuca virosa]